VGDGYAGRTVARLRVSADPRRDETAAGVLYALARRR
jgi:hypothetical protein